MNKQSQKSGNNSTNIQANEITIGLTYQDAREISLDLFKSQIPALVGQATEEVNKRIEKITEDIIVKVINDNPDKLKVFKDPGFQFSLSSVQKDYARTGDDNLGDLLVNLLADRSEEPKRSLIQIVLDEALSTAHKLTEEQLNALAMCFLFRYTHHKIIGNHEDLGVYFDNHIKPIYERMPKGFSSFNHIYFSGCASPLSIGTGGLEQMIKDAYQGLFFKGFDLPTLSNKKFREDRELFAQLIIPCINNPEMYQISSLNEDVLNERIRLNNISDEYKNEILSLWKENLMSNEEVKSKLIELRPYMRNVIEFWNKSEIKNMNLTSVGIAIGHARVKSYKKDYTKLDTWIYESED